MSRTRRSRGSATAAATRARKSANASPRPARASRGALAPEAAPPRPRIDRRLLALVGLTALCLVVAAGYVALAAKRTELQAGAAAAAPTAAPSAIAAVGAQRHVMFLESQGDAFRRIALAPLDGIDDKRVLTDLQCQRAYFAAGRGLCLGKTQMGGAFIFDDSFKPGATLPITGVPSRARVSSDGKYGAMTVFVTGHSYSDGSFSTLTALVDMAGGKLLGDLEQFEVQRDGVKFSAPDFNFWGVTFGQDSNRFYATLGTGGHYYLVEGDVAARTLRVLRDGVECPSLSPDGTRIAFKKREGAGGTGPIQWRLYVLDLSTMTETPLAETRSVDDQVEWWDNQNLVYFLPDEGPPSTIRPDLWVLPVDGSGPAHRVGTAAFSPAVLPAG